MPRPDKSPSRKFLFRCISLCFWIFVVSSLVRGIAACRPTASEKAAHHFQRGLPPWLSDGEIEKAIESFTEAISLVPHWVPAHGYRGDAYAAIKEYEKAISDYSKAIQLAPVVPENRAALIRIYTGRGKAYKELGDDTKAEADFMKAREIEANIKSKP